jgi:NTE family protein
MFKGKKIGLALGGGGARGFAHLGVLKVLEDYGIQPDFIAGTSMGALIGAFYCASPNAKQLVRLANTVEWKNIFDITLPTRGVIKGKIIDDFLKKHIGVSKFEELKIPLFVATTDIENNRQIIFNRGNLAKAVRASISIPGIFIPVKNKGRVLVDGGVIDPLAVEVLKDYADIIIVANVNSIEEVNKGYILEEADSAKDGKLPNIVHTLFRSFHIIDSERVKDMLEKDHLSADLVISPVLKGIRGRDFAKVNKAVRGGEIAARKALDDWKFLKHKRKKHKTLLENLGLK